MTATTVLTAPATPETRPEPGTERHVARTGGAAGLTAALAAYTFAAAVRAAGVPLKVSAKSIPPVGFAQLTLTAAIVGTILAVVLSHRAARPRRTFVITTIALTLASFVPDLLVDAHTTTKVALVLSHVIVAAIVIPALASRLPD